MRTIDFNEVLSSVTNLEPVEGKEYATVADFQENIFASPSDVEAIEAFNTWFKPTSPNCFRLQLSGGMYKRAYGPGLFRTEPTDEQPEIKLVCIAGENTWDVDVSGITFKMLGMEGDLSNVVINGQEYPSVEFTSPDDSFSFNIPIRTISKEDNTHYEKNEIKSLLKGKKLDEFFTLVMPVPKNRGTFLSLPDLGPGEIDLLGIEKAPKGQYGESWFLTVGGGYYTKSNKKLSEQLSKGAERFQDAITSGKPYCLVLGETKFTSQGQKYCDATIYPRKANPDKLSPALAKDGADIKEIPF